MRRFYVVLDVQGDENEEYPGDIYDVAAWIERALGATRPVGPTVFETLDDLVEDEPNA